jgi:hypothetical protein
LDWPLKQLICWLAILPRRARLGKFDRPPPSARSIGQELRESIFGSNQ